MFNVIIRATYTTSVSFTIPQTYDYFAIKLMSSVIELRRNKITVILKYEDLRKYCDYNERTNNICLFKTCLINNQGKTAIGILYLS